MSSRSLWWVVIVAVWVGGVERAGAQATADVERAKARLLEVVKPAWEHPEPDYTYDTWNAMRFALDEANQLAGREGVSAADLDAARVKLEAAVRGLQKRPKQASDAPRLGLAASVFASDPAGPVHHVALMWASADPVDRFELQRASSAEGPFKTIHEGGVSFNDYGLPEGEHFYRVIAHRGNDTRTSGVATVRTTAMPGNLATYSNQRASEERLPGHPLKAGDTYYAFDTVSDNRAMLHVRMRTSKDGRTWQEGPIVLDRNSHPDLADCKFEAVSTFYDPRHDRIVWWCHWELSGPRYGHGRAFVASAKPGEPFTVHHVYNPLGVQVRDMSVFVDEDGRGYLAAASNVPGQGANATLYIFSLNETYDDVTGIVAKVVENGYREAPHIVRRDGFYYLFFSQAAGWYPSRGGYVSARSLAGPWSEPRAIGNTSTFAAQSGHILEFGHGETHVPVMMANRWIRGEGTSRNSALPIQFGDGFAFYDYSPELLHDASRGVLIPLHHGRLLSQDRPADATIPGNSGREPAKAFDGDYDTAFQSDQKQWPFELGVDLGGPSRIRNVQVSWFLHKGSEGFYTYTIDGSLDGKTWKTLVDRTDASDSVVSKTYGFTSDLLPDAPTARYVRVNVRRAHLHNNPNNWYSPTIYEVKVFGDPPERR